MSTIEPRPATPRRSGGRAARVASHADPLAEEVRPIRAGMVGGYYKPRTDSKIERFHQATLDAQEQVLSPEKHIN